MSFSSTYGCLHATLMFNVLFHVIHEGEEVKKFKDGTYKCAANDRIPGIFKNTLGFSGEYAHEDHHTYPTRARRPTHLVDVCYWVMIKPLKDLGLIWGVNDNLESKED